MEKYIFGINPVMEALKSKSAKLKSIIVQKKHDMNRIRNIIKLADSKNIRVEYAKKDDNIFSMNGKHQGVAAIISGFSYKNLSELLMETKDKPHAKILFLDCIEDPHNLGALIRSACAFDFDGVVIQEKRSAPVTPSVMKASAGAIFHVPVCLVKNVVNAIESAKGSGFWSIGTALSADKFIHELDLDMKIALVIGNEEKGIRELTLKRCDFIAKIPISEKIDSLNASAAGACAMYEIMKQQSIRG